MIISFDEFKKDMISLYTAERSISVSVDKIHFTVMMKVEHIFTDDSGYTMQISDDNDTSIVFDKNDITSIEKTSDGISEEYNIYHSDITVIVSII